MAGGSADSDVGDGPFALRHRGSTGLADSKQRGAVTEDMAKLGMLENRFRYLQLTAAFSKAEAARQSHAQSGARCGLTHRARQSRVGCRRPAPGAD